MHSYLAYCGIVSFLTGIPCALFVLFHRPRTQLKVVWSIYSTGVSVWGFAVYHLFVASDAGTALFWGRFCNWCAIFIPILLFHFAVLLTNSWTAKKRQVFLGYAVFIIYCAAAVVFQDIYIPSVSAKGNFRFYPDAGPLYYIFPVLFFSGLFYSLYILYKSYKTNTSTRRFQYKYYMIFSFIAFSGGATTFFLVFNIPIYPFGIVAVPVYNLATVYMIVKHQLMDIRIIIRRSLVYLVLISMITVLYLVVVYMVERMFRGLLGYHSTFGSIAVLTLIAFIFVPLKNRVQSFIEKHIFRASYLQMVEQNNRLRQEILRSERHKMFSDVARSMIIKLRDPLTALIGYGHQLPKRYTDPQFMQKFITVFNKEVGFINELLHHMAQYGEPQPLHLEEVNMTAMLESTAEHFHAQASKHKITVYKYYDPKQSIIMSIDRKKIQRVLYAFFSQAVQSMPEGGQIWVGMEGSMGRLDINIKDSGRGMSPEEIFHNTDLILDPKDKNFELSVAHNIIREHGGKILIESQIDVGTEVVIQIPQLII